MPTVNLLFFDKAFFAINPKKLKIESDPITNRTYFISGGRVVAVATLADQ